MADVDVRLLPPSEWPSKLVGTDLGDHFAKLPIGSQVFVVEHDDEVLGHWALVPYTHAECFWAKTLPPRAKAEVLKKLAWGLGTIAEASGLAVLLTGSDTPQVTSLLKKAKATKLPVTTYAFATRHLLDVAGSLPGVPTARIARCRELGESFHRQLFALLGRALHPESHAHDVAVGGTLERAIDQHDPAGAVAQYNRWAADHGYQPIALVATDDGALCADIHDAVICVNRDYQVTLVEDRRCPQ